MMDWHKSTFSSLWQDMAKYSCSHLWQLQLYPVIVELFRVIRGWLPGSIQCYLEMPATYIIIILLIASCSFLYTADWCWVSSNDLLPEKDFWDRFSSYMSKESLLSMTFCHLHKKYFTMYKEVNETGNKNVTVIPELLMLVIQVLLSVTSIKLQFNHQKFIQ